MVPVLFACSLHAEPNSPPPPDPADAEDVNNYDGAANADAYQHAEVALYDQLRADSSPRQQVLAGRLYFADDENVPSALRPKRETIVARAVQLAPDDALVQWMAASEGSYASSACGPTTWPEAEVANLTRREPDNAAAWQFAVALAAAKGDQAGIDDALSRMASAPRADDHFVEQLDEWKKAYASNPQVTTVTLHHRQGASPQAEALVSALQKVGSGYSSAKSALTEVCKPDAASDRTWQRLGWCVDAAPTLATQGESFELREQGLELLAAAGDHSDSTAALQTQFEWLATNSASPQRNYEIMLDAPDTLLVDWRDARTEIASTEHRLRRLNLPSQAPVGWLKPSAQADADAAEEARGEHEMHIYLATAVAAMQASSDPRRQAIGERALALVKRYARTDADAENETETETAAASTSSPAHRLSDLAHANPDDVLVQWLTANAKDSEGTDASTRAQALANLQRLESDNAAVWANSLSGENATEAFEKIAQGTRYDDHMMDTIRVAAEALKASTLPSSVVEYAQAQVAVDVYSADDVADQLALVIGTATLNLPYRVLLENCKAADRTATCAMLGHLLLYKGGNLINANLGQMILRKVDAFDADDAQFVRQFEWWEHSGAGSMVGVLREAIATGNEIEALRTAAARNGKTEPPAGWVSPSESRLARKTKTID
jgi:hypothetical protein